MSTVVNVSGSSYSVPQEGDSTWATDVSNLLIQLANSTKVLQNTSSSFTLAQDLSFGSIYGLKVQYLKSQSTNPSATGILRLGNTETLSWRNAANTADLALTVNASNALQYNGSSILSAGAASIVDADISAMASLSYSKLNLTGAILNADLAGSIAYGKLSLTGAILNADLAGSIAYGKLSLSNTIRNVDINASAAILLSKLAATTVSRALVSDASGFVSPATTTATEIGYVNGVTSAIQTQINAKAPSASPTFTGTTTVAQLIDSGLTASTVPYADASKQLTSSTVTPTELGYVSGVTSTIQTQLDAKIAKTVTSTTGDMLYASSANTPARLPIGSSGQVIKSVGGVPTWATFSGGINYLSSNPDAESDTTGWATYADAAGTSPVDGTGGTANSTWTRTTSGPLRGLASFLFTRNVGASRQGEGVGYAFTIDTADKAKILQVEFDYLLASGAFTAGSSTTDSELTVWLYDVTNAVIIQPSSYKLLTSSTSTPDKFVGNFQTASNSTSYRLIIHCGSATNAAFTMLFDNFKVGPCNYVYGTPITDWSAYTPVFSAMGTVTGSNFMSRKVGDSLQIRGRFTMGTGTASQAQMTLGYAGASGNVTIDSTKLSNIQLVGMAGYSPAFARTMYVVGEPSTNYVTFSDQANGIFAQKTGSGLASSTESISLEAQVPILGWSSSTQMSDSYDGRKIVASIGLTSAVSPTANNVIIYDTKIEDTTNSYSTSTGLFTAPSAGTYRFSVNALSGTTSNLYIKVAGAAQGVFMTAIAGSAYSGSFSYPLNAGDTAGIYVDTTSTYTAKSGSVGYYNRLSIEKLQAPTTISATEVVEATYRTSADVTIGTANADVVWNTKIDDSHGAMNTSTGIITAPVAGKYFFNLTARHDTGAGVPGEVQYTLIVTGKNAGTYVLWDFNNFTASKIYAVGGSIGLTMNAGDTAKINAVSTTNASTLKGGASLYSFFSFYRVK